MTATHKLLKRQIAKLLTPEQETSLDPFLQKVGATYEDLEKSLALLERSTEISSQELYEANKELLLRSNKIETLYKILTVTNEASSLELAYNIILQEIQNFTKFPIIAIKLYDEEGKTLSLAAHIGIPAEALSEETVPLSPSETPAGIHLLNPNLQVYETSSVEEFKNSKTFWNRVKVGTFVSLPIMAQFKILGVLILVHPETDKSSSILTNWLNVVVTQIGNVIERRNMDATLKLQEANMVAASRMSELGKMAGGIAHEINTPLATIGLLADQLTEAIADPEIDRLSIEKGAVSISQTVERIAKIISGLRTFSRDGSLDPLVSTKVSKIVQETVVFCSEKFRLKNLRLSIAIPEEIELECCPTQISQVLLNLLNNSYDAIEDLQDKWISVTAQQDGNNISIAVTDSGNGISKDVQDKIFNPFFTTKAIGSGTGLGLSISMGIVKSHRGVLKYDSKCVNTRFIIQLPIKRML